MEGPPNKSDLVDLSAGRLGVVRRHVGVADPAALPEDPEVAAAPQAEDPGRAVPQHRQRRVLLMLAKSC